MKGLLNSLPRDLSLSKGTDVWLMIRSNEPQIHISIWLREVRWQINFVIYLLPWSILLLNLAGWWFVLRVHHPHDSLITWKCVVMWWIKNVLSPIPQALWLQYLTGWKTYDIESPPTKSHQPLIRTSYEATWKI